MQALKELLIAAIKASDLQTINVITAINPNVTEDFNELLIAAVRAGDLHTIKILIKIDPNIIPHFAWDPKEKGLNDLLEIALSNNQPTCARSILYYSLQKNAYYSFVVRQIIAGNDFVNVLDPSLILFLNTIFGNAKSLETLLNQGVDPNIKTPYGKTVLIEAVRYNNFDNALCLLNSSKVNPNIQDEKGYSALHHAVFKKWYDLINCFLKVGNVNVTLQDSLNHCPIDYLPSLSDNQNKLVYNANYIYDTELELLPITTPEKIEQYEKIANFLWPNFSQNITYNKLNKVQNIVSHLDLYFRNNPFAYQLWIQNETLKSIFHYAAHSNLVEAMKIFLKYSPASDEAVQNIREESTGKTPVHYAVMHPDNIMLEHFLSYPSMPLTAQDNNGETIFHLAAKHNSYGLTLLINYMNNIMLSEEIDPLSIVDNRGYTPLHTAVESNNLKAVDLLLQYIPLSTDCSGNNALDIAKQKKFRQIENKIRTYSLVTSPSISFTDKISKENHNAINYCK